MRDRIQRLSLGQRLSRPEQVVMRLPVVPAGRLRRLRQTELRIYTIRSTSTSRVTLTSSLLMIVQGVELLELQVPVAVGGSEVRGRRHVERRVDLGGESGHAAA